MSEGNMLHTFSYMRWNVHTHTHWSCRSTFLETTLMDLIPKRWWNISIFSGKLLLGEYKLLIVFLVIWGIFLYKKFSPKVEVGEATRHPAYSARTYSNDIAVIFNSAVIIISLSKKILVVLTKHFVLRWSNSHVQRCSTRPFSLFVFLRWRQVLSILL